MQSHQVLHLVPPLLPATYHPTADGAQSIAQAVCESVNDDVSEWLAVLCLDAEDHVLDHRPWLLYKSVHRVLPERQLCPSLWTYAASLYATQLVVVCYHPSHYPLPSWQDLDTVARMDHEAAGQGLALAQYLVCDIEHQVTNVWCQAPLPSRVDGWRRLLD